MQGAPRDSVMRLTMEGAKRGEEDLTVTACPISLCHGGRYLLATSIGLGLLRRLRSGL